VFRMSTAFEKARAHGGLVRLGLFKLDPRLAETERNRDRLSIVDEVRLGARLGKTQKVENSFLLILRPQALAFDVRPACGKDVDADDRKPDQHRDDHEERRND